MRYQVICDTGGKAADALIPLKTFDTEAEALAYIEKIESNWLNQGRRPPDLIVKPVGDTEGVTAPAEERASA